LQPFSPLRRLHQTLMPDYNRRATAYWWTVVPLGLAAIAWASADIASRPWTVVMQIAAGVVMAGLAGGFPIMIPRTKTSFALGEVFTFLLLFMHGPAPAVLAAAAEAAVASARTSRRWTSRIGGPALTAISMAGTGFLLEIVVGWPAGLQGIGMSVLVALALWLAIFHFMLNTALVAALPRLKRGEWLQWSDLTGSFGLTLGMSAVCACGAALLSEAFRAYTLPVLATITPALLMLVTIVRGFFRQQEATRALSEAEAQAARREADITARHLQQMHEIAFHDALTGLPNRRMLLAELDESVRLHRENHDRGYALLFLDFDRFKLINDTLGHAAGDTFLKHVSQRLSAQVEAADLVARLGGDEFAVLLRRPVTLDAVDALAARIQQAVGQPYLVSGTELTSSASIGITTSARGYEVPQDVLRDADIAMYRAKAAGKARHVVFDAQMHRELARRLRLESDLRRALADGALTLAYQPVFRLSDGQPLGFEALARWTHPELGEIEPVEFVPIAEESGLAPALTDYVLALACTQLRRWHARWPAVGTLGMQVNLSDRDLAQRTLPERVRAVLRETGVQPDLLWLELTEGTIMRRLATQRSVLLELRALGTRLVIDDFGRGYSSLGQLSSLPIDGLKIDCSFVAGIGQHHDTSAIVRTILQLGQSLGRMVVAEGVETHAQLEWLRSAGCDAAQGRGLAAPMAAPAVEAWLERQHGWGVGAAVPASAASPAVLMH
jgi:diguanylate cyclase (GGDEF)-like protein